MIPGKNHNRVFSFGVLIAYCAAGVVAILHHAMWRDEVFPWLLARDSHSFRELLINVRHDSGHLPLWHFLLWLVTRFTTNPVAEQILHLSIGALAVWLFVDHSPFSKTQKLLFAFGYFPLFEYCVVCRMYSIVWLLLFAFCACFESRHRTYLPLAGILSLMALTTTLGTVLALAFAGALVLEARTHRPPRGDVLLSASVFAVALFLAAVFLWQHVDHPDVGAVNAWSKSSGAMKFLHVWVNVWRAYVPIPVGFPHWPAWSWGTNAFIDRWFPNDWPFVLLGAGIVATCIATLTGGARLPLLLYAFGVTGLLLFQTVAWCALRHAGLFLVLYLSCLWLAKNRAMKIQNAFLNVVLVAQLIGGLYSWSAAFSTPFSGSAAVARFIEKQGWRRLPVCAARGNEVQSIAAYLNRNLYYPDSAKFGSFFPPTDPPDAGPQKVLSASADLVTESNSDVVLVMSYRLYTPAAEGLARVRSAILNRDGSISSPAEIRLEPSISMTLTGEFSGITYGETYYMYYVHQN